MTDFSKREYIRLKQAERRKREGISMLAVEAYPELIQRLSEYAKYHGVTVRDFVVDAVEKALP